MLVFKIFKLNKYFHSNFNKKKLHNIFTLTKLIKLFQILLQCKYKLIFLVKKNKYNKKKFKKIKFNLVNFLYYYKYLNLNIIKKIIFLKIKFFFFL